MEPPPEPFPLVEAIWERSDFKGKSKKQKKIHKEGVNMKNTRYLGEMIRSKKPVGRLDITLAVVKG